MKLEHEFTVPAPVDEAWKVLLDVERVAPCMPGATLLTIDGDSFTGTVKVKVGPIQVTYKGQAKFASLDESGHRAVIEASGKEARGSGTAAATVTAVLVDAGSSTTNVKVETDLDVTGRPAQFGRGVMAEVAAKLIGQFAKCLADELGSPASASSSSSSTAAAAPEPAAKAAEPAAKATESAAKATESKPAAAASTPAPPKPAESKPAASASKPTPPAEQPAPAAKAATPPQSSGPRHIPPPARAAEPIDLLDVAGGSVAKRLAPVAAVVTLLLLLLWRRRHRH